jgi:hypothetical protein
MRVLFRAKEKNTDNYIIGYEYYNHIEDEYYITHYITGNNYKVDKSTRSINFEDMVDSNRNKIFASLQEDGKGGDICQTIDYLNGTLSGIAIYDNFSFRIHRIGKAMGISFTSKDIKIIEIQE